MPQRWLHVEDASFVACRNLSRWWLLLLRRRPSLLLLLLQLRRGLVEHATLVSRWNTSLLRRRLLMLLRRWHSLLLRGLLRGRPVEEPSLVPRRDHPRSAATSFKHTSTAHMALGGRVVDPARWVRVSKRGG